MLFNFKTIVPLALFAIHNENVQLWSALSPSSSGMQVHAFSATSSFLSRPTLVPSQSKADNKSRHLKLSMVVVDRMSEECVAATQVAQRIGNEIGLRFLQNEVLVAGISNRPEKAGRTLAKYNLAYPLIRKASEKTLQNNGFQLKNEFNRDTLIQKDKPLPFSEDVKITLKNAAQIASYFDSNNINSEHVLLALMGYNYGKPIDQQNVPVGLEILRSTENINDNKFSAYDFCEELVQDMKLPYDLSENPATEEVVVIGGGSTKTNTLEEVGVDLTEMAVQGRLDRVYGRDNEIKMALRTLGRRRKNNPCLIGDPGVGKVSVH